MGSRHLLTWFALLLSGVAALPVAGQKDRSTSRSCSPVLEWNICTWVVMEEGVVVELGATLPIAVVEAVPVDAEMVWPPKRLATVALPVEAQTMLGIDHMAVNWEVRGHPPTPFTTPHFDLHFYNLPESEIRAIDCSDETKPSTLPAHHTLPDIEIPGMGTLVGLCVPQMGMHAMADTEMAGTNHFEASLVLGYYEGEPIFFEPMISRDRLLARSNFALPVPAVEGLPAGVHYPREFRAEFIEAENEYRMTFTGFGSKQR